MLLVIRFTTTRILQKMILILRMYVNVIRIISEKVFAVVKFAN